MRYTVSTIGMPSDMKAAFCVAWVRDNIDGVAVSWHHYFTDAYRVCAALNAADQREKAERALARHAHVMEF